MYQFIRTDIRNKDFIQLVKLLDTDLAVKDGDDHSFYSQYNKIDSLNHVLVAYENQMAVGCGAIKIYNPSTVEIKRMFVLPDWRGKGIATKVLLHLEAWAAELEFTRCILETGKRQPDAIALYEKNGYTKISNYGQYTGVDNSVCFERYFK